MSSNSSGDEESEEVPNSRRHFLHGSPRNGDSPLNSSESQMEEESDSLGRRNGHSGGEDSDSDGFQLPLEENPNFSPSPGHTFDDAEEEESSSLDEEEISNFDRFRLPLKISSGSPSSVHSSEGDEDADICCHRRSQSSKQRKSPQEDFISSLPGCILLHILSFLPANSGIRTGVLSKRWMNLWKNSTNLIFNHKGIQFMKFANSVNRTLVMYSSPKIKKFQFHDQTSSSLSLCQKLINKERSFVDSWLQFAIGRDVEELSLKFNYSKSDSLVSRLVHPNASTYEMPKNLYECSSLTKLSSTCCFYEPEGQVSWGSLRKLSIGASSLSSDVFQKILVGSPMLKCVKLMEVEIDSIDVSSNSGVERLVIRDVRPWQHFRISAPYVKSLEILGNWKASNFWLSNASSVVNARIEFVSCRVVHEEDARDELDFVDMVRQLLEQINHAKKLTLGCVCIQVLSLLDYRGLPSPLVKYNCKRLSINLSGIHDFELPGIASLLYNSPTLEKLVINFDTKRFKGTLPSFKNHSKLEEDVWKSKERSYSCLLGHLKIIEFVGLEKCSCNGPADTIVQFLLRNGSVLEKVVLYPGHDSCGNSHSWYRWARKLLSIQKASPHALVFLPNPEVC